MADQTAAPVEEQDEDQGIDLVKDAFEGEAVEAVVAPSRETLTEDSTDREIARNRRAATKAALDAQPKVRVYVPAGANELVKVNGYAYLIQADSEVDVPRQVAEMLHAKWRAQAKVNTSRERPLGVL